MNNIKLCFLLLAMFAMIKLYSSADTKCDKPNASDTDIGVKEADKPKDDAIKALKYTDQAQKEAEEVRTKLKACCMKCKELYALQDAAQTFKDAAYAKYKEPVENIKDSEVVKLLDSAERETGNFTKRMEYIEEAFELINRTVTCANAEDAGKPNDNQVMPLKEDTTEALRYLTYAQAEGRELQKFYLSCCMNCADFFAFEKALVRFKEKAFDNFARTLEYSTDLDVKTLVARARDEKNFIKKMRLIEEANDKQKKIDEANKNEKNNLNIKIRNAIEHVKELQREYEPSNVLQIVMRKLLSDLMKALASEKIMDKKAALDAYNGFINSLSSVTTSTIATTTTPAEPDEDENDDDFLEWLIDALFNKW